MNPISTKDLVQKYSEFIVETSGPLDSTLIDFPSRRFSSENSFLYITEKRNLVLAKELPAGCFLTDHRFKNLALKAAPDKNWLFSKNAKLTARKIKNELVLATPFRAKENGIHPTAIVDSTAVLGKNTIIGPHCVIGANVIIKDHSFIGANTVVEENSSLGENVTIHPLVYIGHSTQIGNDVEIMPQTTIASEGFGYAQDAKGNHYRIPHTGNVIIEDDVHIGANCAIDRGTLEPTLIGRGTKVDNQVHFGHNFKIGKNGLVTANMVTAGSVEIGDRFISGGIVGLGGHQKITDDVHIAGLSAVTKDIKTPGPYGGHPLEPLSDCLKNRASFRHLTDMRKKLNHLWKLAGLAD